MKIIQKDFKELKQSAPLTITIGSFDGVHLGHTKLIKQTKLFKETKSAVMTFNYPNKDKQLLSLAERIKKISELKPDYIYVIPFTEEFASLSAFDFIRLLKKIGVVRIVCGTDFTFGFEQKGNTSNLFEAFELNIASDLIVDNQKVSSTLIKELLESSYLQKASTMLGYSFYTKGEIVKGNGIGASLGFRTANLDIKNTFLPKLGVYYAIAYLGGKSYPALVNLGYNPTIKLSPSVRVEAHLLNFNKDIYGKELVIEYKKFIRTEQKFNNHDDLIRQIKNDLKNIEEII